MADFKEVEAPESVETDKTPVAALEQLLVEENELDQDAEQDEAKASEEETEQSETEQAEEAEGPSEDSEEDLYLSDEYLEAKRRLKVNGEEREVTLNDLIEGFQLKSDYTRSKQELAERERQLQEQAQGISAYQQQYEQAVNEMGERLEALIPDEPDWGKLAKEHPDAYDAQRAAWNQLQAQLQSVNQEKQRIAQEKQQAYQQTYAQYLAGEQKQLLAQKPDLSDQAKAQEFFSGITNHLVNEYGFAPQEIAQVADHRMLLVAEKAMMYDRMKGNKKGDKIPPLKPGSRQNQSVRSQNFSKARKRLAKSGSVEDAASAIEQLL